MALTAGLLVVPRARGAVRGVRAAGALPSALGGAGVVLLGFVVSYLTLTYLSHKLAALATLVAIGIGLHNFGEGLAIGTSFAFGELALGTFLIIGFMIHNVTEGLGIATAATEERRVSFAPARAAGADRGRARDPRHLARRLRAQRRARRAVLRRGRGCRVRGRRSRSGAGCARARRAGLTSGWVLGGFLAGVSIMYVTGVLAG